MEDKIKTIREACVKANPDIMKLVDGCKIKIWWMENPNERLKYPDEVCDFTSRSMSDNGKVDDEYHQIIEDNVTGTIKILGRKIGLADVLLAINRPRFFIDTDGWIGELVAVKPKKCVRRIKWDLKEDLEHQTEEVIDFIYSLIK